MKTSQLHVAIAFILINIFSFTYIFTFSGFFFRDYSIIFDGGLRISAGQVPYRDFYLPIGPMVLYLQAFFNWVIGAGTNSLLLHASVLNSIVLSCFFLYAQKHINLIPALGLTFIFHFFYYGATVNPWYNHTALFFYILAQLLLLNECEKEFRLSWLTLIMLGFLSTLSLFSKQDIGALGIAFIGSQIVFFSVNRWRDLIIFIVTIVIFTSLIVVIYQQVSDFGYWFNYGQPPHSSRIHRLSGLVGKYMIRDVRWHILVIVPVLFLLLKDFRQNTWMHLYLTLGFAGFSLIIFHTSGQSRWTAYFALPFVGVFLIRLLIENKNFILAEKHKNTVIYLICWILLAYCYPIALKNISPVGLNLNKSYHPLQNSSYQGMLFQSEVLAGIEKIKAELQNKKSSDDSEWLLNMSSYTFLYQDFGVVPPVGTHLWYHFDVTTFEEDYRRFKERLREKPFEYILLQEMSSGTPESEFHQYLASIGYQSLFSVPTPKSGRDRRYDLTVYRYSNK